MKIMLNKQLRIVGFLVTLSTIHATVPAEQLTAAQIASKYIDSFAALSKDAINSVASSLAQNDYVQKAYENLSSALFIVEIGNILIKERVNVVPMRKLYTQNPALMGKLMPLTCTIVNEFLNDVLRANNAPKNVLESLQVLASYGQENNYVLSMQQTRSAISADELKQKEQLVMLFLERLDYNSVRSALKMLMQQTNALNILPANIDDKIITESLDRAIQSTLINHLTIDELKALADFAVSKTVTQLKEKPEIFTMVFNVVLKSLNASGFDKKFAAAVATQATPILASLQEQGVDITQIITPEAINSFVDSMNIPSGATAE